MPQSYAGTGLLFDGFSPTSKLSEMALGDCLGAGFLRTVNGAPLNELHRWLCILGDPTHRNSYLNPPWALTAQKIGSTISLNWTAGETGSKYYIYRAASRNGPYEQVTTTPASPIDGTGATATENASKTFYMVRGAKPVSSGSGTYANLSQGSIKEQQ